MCFDLKEKERFMHKIFKAALPLICLLSRTNGNDFAATAQVLETTSSRDAARNSIHLLGGQAKGASARVE